MIVSFGDEATYELFMHGTVPKKGCGWVDVADVAARKLDALDAAEQITDLWRPPGNRPEKLEGDEDWYSIRINDRWRIVFQWTDDGKEAVEITDYHD